MVLMQLINYYLVYNAFRQQVFVQKDVWAKLIFFNILVKILATSEEPDCFHYTDRYSLDLLSGH